MKRLFFLIALFYCLGGSIYAQENYSQKWGRPTQYEMDMTAYEQDSEAEAVVIYDTGKSFFRPNRTEGGFELYMERTFKIKILNQAGIKHANHDIPYYMENNKREEIYDLEANTYNFENGQLIITPLEKANIFTEKINDYWSKKVFAMPNVREGSIIEIKYTIISPYIFNIREWNFQKEIPVVESTFRMGIIPYYEFSYIMTGSTVFDISKSEVDPREYKYGRLTYQEMIHTFGKKNIPAFKDVDFISSDKDYMISLNFQLSKVNYPQGGSKNIMTSWPEICNELLSSNHFGKYIKDAEKQGQKIIPTLELNGKSEDEQIETIVNYIKRTYRWNSIYSKYSTENVSRFQKEQSGNSTDMNLFLLGLLKAAKINAQPVATSTRGNGTISIQHPFNKFFNYVIVRVIKTDGSSLILDATEPLLKYDKLPNRCNNIKGLVVDKNSNEWIDITQPELSLTEKSFKIEFDEDFSMQKSDITYTAYNHDAFLFRNRYRGNSDNLKEFLQNQNITPTGQIATKNELDLGQPFIFSFQTETPIDKLSDKLFISPFANLSVTENIFKQNTQRVHPIDFIHKPAERFHCSIIIPEGYEVESLPTITNNNSKRIRVKYEAKETDGRIEIFAEYEFNQSQYTAEEYTPLKLMFDAVIKKFNEIIVLRKKGDTQITN